VKQIREPIDHRDARNSSEFLDQRVAEGPRDDAVDPAREVARDILRRFSGSDPDLFRPKQDRMPSELRHARFEGDVCPQRGLFEEHREHATRQRRMLLRLPAKLLEFSRAIEQREQLFSAPIGECDEVLGHFSA
jgi:hypothetical protein